MYENKPFSPGKDERYHRLTIDWRFSTLSQSEIRVHWWMHNSKNPTNLGRREFNSSLHQSSHGFATRVHSFATKTKALARESRQLRRLIMSQITGLDPSLSLSFVIGTPGYWAIFKIMAWVFVTLFSYVSLDEIFKRQNKVSMRNLFLVLITGWYRLRPHEPKLSISSSSVTFPRNKHVLFHRAHNVVFFSPYEKDKFEAHDP